jgi:hypothetical protein
MNALNKVVNYGICGYLSNLNEDDKSTLNNIVNYWMKNKKKFMEKAEIKYPYGNGLECQDSTVEYVLSISICKTLTLRISNPNSVVYNRLEGWYL